MDYEALIPWRHGCGLYEAPCGCLYDLHKDLWCAVCPQEHGDLNYAPDCFALQALATYVAAEKEPGAREGVLRGGRRVAREAALWHWVSEYDLEDPGMAQRFLTQDQHLDLLVQAEAYDRRMGSYAATLAAPAIERLRRLGVRGVVVAIFPRAWRPALVEAQRAAGFPLLGGARVEYTSDEQSARVEAGDVSVRIPRFAQPRRNARFDELRALLTRADDIRCGRRQPPKQGTPASKSGRPRSVGPCTHRTLPAPGGFRCFKCGELRAQPSPP